MFVIVFAVRAVGHRGWQMMGPRVARCERCGCQQNRTSRQHRSSLVRSMRKVKLSNSQVFISYCRDDVSRASALEAELLNTGFRTWRDEGRFPYGEAFVRHLAQGLSES